jgi:OmpA-OmpF porin, OOP family
MDTSQTERSRAFNRRHLIGAIALVVLLALLWLFGRGPLAGCCGGTPVAAPAVPPAVAAPATTASAAMPMLPDDTEVNATVTGGKLRLTGTVKNQATKAVLIGIATAAVGEANVSHLINIDTGVNQPAWLANVVENAGEPGELFPWFKARDDGGLVAIGNKVTLSGTVPTEAEKTARGVWATKYFGASAVVDNQIAVTAPAVAAAPSAPAAPVASVAQAAPVAPVAAAPAPMPATPAAAKADDNCGEALKARIEFASGRATLTRAGKAVLDKVARCLVGAKIEVAGHTDDRGGDAVNMALSQARAQTVVGYLGAR